MPALLQCAFAILLLQGGAAAASTVTLGELVQRLELQGYSFVFSRSLADRQVELQEPPTGVASLPAFRAALAGIDLTLERDARGVFYIVPIAQPPTGTGPVKGRVTNADTGQPLRGVAVSIEDTIVYTDQDGFFELPSTRDAPLSVDADGFEATTVSARTIEQHLEIPLQPAPRGLEEVVVVSSRYALDRSASPSVRALDADELSGIPELGDDVLRVANHLPGTASIGISAKPHIRGGLQDELLILFNNVELLEPFHLKDFQNVFASFNPSLIDRVDVYTGGFPARFGDRMSGVMDIQPALPTSAFKAELMLSLLTASASATGMSRDGRARWAASARRGNLDFVLDQVDRSTGDPEYSDYFATFAYQLTPASELEVGFIAYDDNVLLKDLDDGDGELADSRYENFYTWAQLHHDFSARSYGSTVLSFGTIDHDRQGFINDEDPEEGSSRLDDERHFDVFSLSHRHHLDLSDAVAVELGGRLNYQEGDYDSRAEFLRGALGDIIGLPPIEQRLVRTSPSGTSGGFYTAFRIRPVDRLLLELGGRWDFQDYGRTFDRQFSPRFSSRLDLAEHTHLRLSAGRFYQPEQIHELQAADGVADFQAPQYADHYIIGLDQEFPQAGLSLRVEGFVKNVRDTKLRFENLFNPWVLMPEITSDRVALAPQKARSRGFEISAGYEPSDRLNTWASYSYASSDDRLNDAWVPRSWDQEHTLSTGLIWRPGQWTVSAALIWHSGWRTTRPPELVAEGETPELARNADELPSYVSLDAKIARTWQFSRNSVTLFAEITNVLDRDNVGAYEYDVEELDAGGYEVIPERFTLLPRVPSIGIRWSFE